MTDQTQKETLNFQAQVKELLHLVTHSLYSNKEIFLRELISNASDACDKLRFEALQDANLYEQESDLKIYIYLDKKANTITVVDNGIGMSRTEVIENLGTIAKSGTREFLNKLNSEQTKDANLIGQFGVGFYAAFVVAEKVVVETRRAGLSPEEGIVWESTGEGEYHIQAKTLAKRGTAITLYLREESKEFIDEWRLRSIVTKYSDHILFPIVMQKEEIEADTDTKPDKKVKEDAKPPKMVDEVVNRATALWTLPKSQIQDQQYQELYKHIAHDFEDALTWSHNKVEGKLEYISLLYIPARAPYDLWNREQRHGLKLYVKRVFIMDDAEQLLPGYLRFIKGIVDSNDLPLNVSRELLQSSQIIDSIRAGCVKRILDMLETLAKDEPEKYTKFWLQFGQVLKEGPYEDFANKDRIAKLLRFSTTHTDKSEQTISFADYVTRMPAEQKKIYYVTADTFNAAKNSPHLEIFRQKGIEVILLFDRIDEWMVNSLPEFEGKPLQSVAKGNLDMESLKNKEDTNAPQSQDDKTNNTEWDSFLARMKKELGDQITDVRLTNRLTDSPVCLVSGDHEMSLNLQNMLKTAGQSVPDTKPILEINATHPLIQKMQLESDEDRFHEWVLVLFDQAKLAQGTPLEDPATFVKRFNRLLMEFANS